MRKLTAILLFMGIFDISFAQNDSSSLRYSSLIIANSNTIDDASKEIYNGIEHLGYMAYIEGSAYFNSNEWQKGQVVYRNVLYPDVYLKYDQVKDEVIVRHFNGYTAIRLFTPRVQSFSIPGSSFINIDHFNKEGSAPAGLYQVLTEGPYSLLVKRSATINEHISTTVVRRFITSNQYYLLRDQQLNPVQKENDVFVLFPGMKNDLKEVLRKSNLKFKKNQEKALLKLTEYINQHNR